MVGCWEANCKAAADNLIEAPALPIVLGTCLEHLADQTGVPQAYEYVAGVPYTRPRHTGRHSKHFLVADTECFEKHSPSIPPSSPCLMNYVGGVRCAWRAGSGGHVIIQECRGEAEADVGRRVGECCGDRGGAGLSGNVVGVAVRVLGGGVREPRCGDSFPADSNSLAAACRTPTGISQPSPSTRTSTSTGCPVRPAQPQSPELPPPAQLGAFRVCFRDHTALLHSLVAAGTRLPPIASRTPGKTGQLSSKSSGPANRNGTITNMACLFSYFEIQHKAKSRYPDNVT